jgi:hypothetical protein
MGLLLAASIHRRGFKVAQTAFLEKENQERSQSEEARECQAFLFSVIRFATNLLCIV